MKRLIFLAILFLPLTVFMLPCQGQQLFIRLNDLKKEQPEGRQVKLKKRTLLYVTTAENGDELTYFFDRRYKICYRIIIQPLNEDNLRGASDSFDDYWTVQDERHWTYKLDEDITLVCARVRLQDGTMDCFQIDYEISKNNKE